MTPDVLFMQNLPLIERIIAFVARRQKMHPDERDDFAQNVRLKLIENDYAILARFEGRSSLATFLTVVIQRMCLDQRIQQWGKWRPSAEARRLGRTAIDLEMLTHRDGMSFDEAVATLRQRDDSISRADLEGLRQKLPERARRPRTDSDNDEVFDTLAAADSADSLTSERDRSARAKRISKAISAVLTGADPEDVVLMRMRFVDGLKVSTIASTLGLEQKRLYKRIDRMLLTLRTALTSEGFGSGEVGDILDEGSEALSIPFFSSAERKTKGGPSPELNTNAMSGGTRNDIRRWT